MTISALTFLFTPVPLAAAADAPEVRVLILENATSIQVTVKGAYIVRSLPDLVVLKKGEGLLNAPLAVTARGIRLDKQEWLARGIRVEPAKDRELFLNTRRFRGVADVLRNKKGSLNVVNKLSVESYLYGVLHHEVAPWWPMNALKAQAVAARTYALYQMRVSQAFDYDLKSGTSSQVYGGSTTERYRTKRAVDLTAGQVLVNDTRLFPAYFHATCAGMTAGADELWNIRLPSLSGKVKCPYCRFSPHYSWEAKVPLAEIEEKMNKNGRAAGQILKIEPISQTPSGRVGSLRITGTVREITVAAKDFRIWVGGDRVRSTSFTVAVRDDMAEFHGKGWGHGVGLCQWGSFGQALLGHDHLKILRFYYPGSQLAQYRSELKLHEVK
ncbi:MAG: SpoIID/LytB domain-containing protein [Candidatus Omnitrophota bacterium]